MVELIKELDLVLKTADVFLLEDKTQESIGTVKKLKKNKSAGWLKRWENNFENIGLFKHIYWVHHTGSGPLLVLSVSFPFVRGLEDNVFKDLLDVSPLASLLMASVIHPTKQEAFADNNFSLEEFWGTNKSLIKNPAVVSNLLYDLDITSADFYKYIAYLVKTQLFMNWVQKHERGGLLVDQEYYINPVEFAYFWVFDAILK